MSKPFYKNGNLHTILVSEEAFLAIKRKQAEAILEGKCVTTWQAASELILRKSENIEKIDEEKSENQAEILPPPPPPPLKKRLAKSRKKPTKNLKRKQHSKGSTNFTR